MGIEGGHDAHGTRGRALPPMPAVPPVRLPDAPPGAVPPPVVPPLAVPPGAAPGVVPPPPARAPYGSYAPYGPSGHAAAGAASVPVPAAERFLGWLRTPRAADAPPGIWRYGHRPKPPREPDEVSGRRLISGAVISFFCGWLLWSLLYNRYLGDYWLWPLHVLMPDAWIGSGSMWIVTAGLLYYAVVIALLAVVFGRLGRWPEVWRRYVLPPLRRLREDGDPATAQAPRSASPEADPAAFPDVRAGGAPDAAERLAAEARAGRMNDVDAARIARAWRSARTRPDRLADFTDTVLRHGATAWTHPSGARDLPAPRIARHDLLTGQVRLGLTVEDERNPYRHRGAGFALDPDLLGTSLLAVGPPASGKTAHLVRPVLESLCLQALAGQAAVVAVGAAGTPLAPDDAFDVVLRIGRPDSDHDLDLYGGTTDPDEAAGILAEALIGDLALTLPGGDGRRRAATALAQLLGPFRAAHGRFPAVPELRELLDGSPAALTALRTALETAATGPHAHLRDLEARERQLGRAGDIGAVLAERVALLDRPAFAGFFDPAGESRQFSLRALDHPLRVRIDLPERGHAEASRMLARLVLAQFVECASARTDHSLFACLILDDATHTVTPEALRGLQRLRSAGAGAVLALRTLDDVPEALRGALLGAVGCRMAFAGVTPWDGARFAEVWGTEWVEARDVTSRPVLADEPLTRVLHFIRALVTGKPVTTESVTVRQVQRERWSASELANALPAGHAVLSLRTVRGEHAPPLLVNLRG
ncbi:ATP-binding protein [Streptomyces sp. URMC 123]|uniref:ATP-binding protein n=1 Tax=Streptomyces sp. URMC 123 TaxID=3423403 RepID=UPI003F1B1381